MDKQVLEFDIFFPVSEKSLPLQDEKVRLMINGIY